jgi:hypothetical protein
MCPHRASPCLLIDWPEKCCSDRDLTQQQIYDRLLKHGGHRSPECFWNKET